MKIYAASWWQVGDSKLKLVEWAAVTEAVGLRGLRRFRPNWPEGERKEPRSGQPATTDEDGTTENHAKFSASNCGRSSVKRPSTAPERTRWRCEQFPSLELVWNWSKKRVCWAGKPLKKARIGLFFLHPRPQFIVNDLGWSSWQHIFTIATDQQVSRVVSRRRGQSQSSHVSLPICWT